MGLFMVVYGSTDPRLIARRPIGNNRRFEKREGMSRNMFIEARKRVQRQFLKLVDLTEDERGRNNQWYSWQFAEKCLLFLIFIGGQN